MNTQNNIKPNVFLNGVRKSRVGVIIHLVNGFQLKGVVKGFDNFIIMLDSDGKQMMIYKHAITTITPSKPVSFNREDESADRE